MKFENDIRRLIAKPFLDKLSQETPQFKQIWFAIMYLAQGHSINS